MDGVLDVFRVLLFPFLHVSDDGRDVVAWEHARLTVAATFPPVGV